MGMCGRVGKHLAMRNYYNDCITNAKVVKHKATVVMLTKGSEGSGCIFLKPCPTARKAVFL